MRSYSLIFLLLFLAGVTDAKAQKISRKTLNHRTLMMAQLTVDNRSVFPGEQIILNAMAGDAILENGQLLNATVSYSLDSLMDNLGNLTTLPDAKSYFQAFSADSSGQTINVNFKNISTNALEVTFSVNGVIHKASSRYHIAALSDRWAIIVEPVLVRPDGDIVNKTNSNAIMQLGFSITLLK